MSRNPRISYPGAFFHTISRAMDGIALFQDDDVFLLFEKEVLNF